MKKLIEKFIVGDKNKHDKFITADIAREISAYGLNDYKTKRDRFISLINYTCEFIKHKAQTSVNGGTGGRSCTIDFSNGYETLMNEYYYRLFTLFFIRRGFTVLDISKLDERVKGSFCIHWVSDESVSSSKAPVRPRNAKSK